MTIEEDRNYTTVTFDRGEHYGASLDVIPEITEEGILVDYETLSWIIINQLRDNLRARKEIERQ